MIDLFKKKDLIAAAGRARLEEQKKTALTNIQKNRDAALKQLDIQYASADKAKKSFGYIGIIFLTVLFGSIFLNDLIKLCIYYFNCLRDWWRHESSNKKKSQENKKIESEVPELRIEMQQDYLDHLDASLEQVYFKLVKVNAKMSNK